MGLKCSEFDLTYDLVLFPQHLPVACELVRRFSDQRFVLDHIAKPPIKTGQMSPWDANVRRLASFPNVYCKVSGLVTEADWDAWQPADFRPYLDVIFEAFAPRRVMFGSDWPVCTLAGTYADVVQIIDNYVQQFSVPEQAAIWGQTATRFYGLE